MTILEQPPNRTLPFTRLDEIEPTAAELGGGIPSRPTANRLHVAEEPDELTELRAALVQLVPLPEEGPAPNGQVVQAAGNRGGFVTWR